MYFFLTIFIMSKLKVICQDFEFFSSWNFKVANKNQSFTIHSHKIWEILRKDFLLRALSGLVWDLSWHLSVTYFYVHVVFLIIKRVLCSKDFFCFCAVLKQIFKVIFLCFSCSVCLPHFYLDLLFPLSRFSFPDQFWFGSYLLPKCGTL